MTPTKIKIPKVKGVQTLFINRTDVEEFERGAKVTLKKVTLDGFTIPHGTRIWVDFIFNTSSGIVMLEESKVNQILRTLYFDQLRTKTKQKHGK